MSKGILRVCILVGCFSLASVAATAQLVVHALTGTAHFIDTTAKTITVKTDRGSTILFTDQTDPQHLSQLGKKITADATAADVFKEEGTRVIVYFTGGGDMRTAVALRNLGTGAFTTTSGTVEKLDAKEHVLTIEVKPGEVVTYKLAYNTVSETTVGVVEGSKPQLKKGDTVRVIARPMNESATALFIDAINAD